MRRYLHVLSAPGVAWVAVAAVLQGIALAGALPLAMVLFIRAEAGSFAAAGAVAAASALAGALTSPVRGRLVDRHGQTRVLGVCAVLSHAALVGLIAAALADAPVTALVALSALAGGTAAPLFPALRALWGTLVDEPLRDSAYALQSVLIEVMYLGGPLVAAALVAAGSPTLAISVVAGTSLLASLAFVAAPASRAWRGEAADEGAAPSRWGALATPGMRTLVLAQVPYGAVIGALDVTAPAFADAHGDAAAGGFALAALALGSFVGGLAYGAHEWPGDRAARLLALTVLFALPLLPLALVGSLPLLVVLLALAGLAIAPATASVFGLLDTAAPRGTVTEAATWIVTAYAAGAAGGAAAAGALADDGARGGLLLISVLAVAAVIPVAARPRTLRATPPADTTTPAPA